MNSADLMSAIVALETIPDDKIYWSEIRDPDEIDDPYPASQYPPANRRQRRTKRRSKARKRWLVERAALFSGVGHEPRRGDFTIVMSPYWVRRWKDYYNIDREL